MDSDSDDQSMEGLQSDNDDAESVNKIGPNVSQEVDGESPLHQKSHESKNSLGDFRESESPAAKVENESTTKQLATTGKPSFPRVQFDDKNNWRGGF